MTAKLTRKRAILAKIETTYGTDPTPTGGANAILIKNPAITPLSATPVSRDNIKTFLGENPQLLADTHVAVSFDVELAGSGALGTAPAYGPLLRACGLSETISAGVSVTYAPISAAFESVTLYVNVDGINHVVTGCRGTFEIDIATKTIPAIKFTFTGIYNAPTDTALPATTLTAFQAPLISNNAHTTGFSFFGVSGLILETYKLMCGNTVTFMPYIGAETVEIMDRKASGQVVFEAPTLATFNTFSTALATTSGAMSITHGTVTGNKVTIAAPAITIGNPTYTDSNGLTTITAPLFVSPSTGNDEFSITVI